jgi:hypothetical protein
MKYGDEIVLFVHITDSGAIYLTDSHNLFEAKIIIRLDTDNGADLVRCDIETGE